VNGSERRQTCATCAVATTHILPQVRMAEGLDSYDSRLLFISRNDNWQV
jgi:hypothetical protein